MESPDRNYMPASRKAAAADRAPDASQALPGRRGSERHLAVCRTARIDQADDTGLWRVRNISDTGMMLAADIAVSVGERLDISLSETICLSASVQWTRSGRCGVSFDVPVDAPALLQRLADEQQVEGYRALRVPVEQEAMLVLRCGAILIDLVDLSQHGAGFRCDATLEPGSHVELVLPAEAARRPALVRWSHGKRGGIWFAQPLERLALESIAKLRGQMSSHAQKASTRHRL
ncbi:PilZ domain-containing protein [Sphingopyxis sp. 550A]